MMQILAMRARRRSLLCLLGLGVIAACADRVTGIVPTAPELPVPRAPRALGLVEITISGIGGPGMRATATPLGGSAGSGANALPSGPSFSLAPVPNNTIQLEPRTVATLDFGGQRYLQAVFAVRNLSLIHI